MSDRPVRVSLRDRLAARADAKTLGLVRNAVDKIVSPEPEGQENVVVAAFQSSI